MGERLDGRMSGWMRFSRWRVKGGVDDRDGWIDGRKGVDHVSLEISPFSHSFKVCALDNTQLVSAVQSSLLPFK